MYLRIGRKILNTENMTDADVYEPGEPLHPHDERLSGERAVVITTTATETAEDGTPRPRRIILEGEDADLFLESLPTYSPVLEGDRW